VSVAVWVVLGVGVGVKRPDAKPTDPIHVPQVSGGEAAYSATIQKALDTGSTATPL
jgi:hypothetical protein